jgi:hypothetical protein
MKKRSLQVSEPRGRRKRAVDRTGSRSKVIVLEARLYGAEQGLSLEGKGSRMKGKGSGIDR